MHEEVVAALDELWASTLGLLAEVRDDEWALPTPCTDWDVRQLAAHIAAGQSSFEGFPQPEPPPGWTTNKEGVDRFTAAHVAGRDGWTPQEIVRELTAATSTQVARFAGLDATGWGAPTEWPPGNPTMYGLARNRVLDAYIHLLDLRVALGRPLDLDAEPLVFDECLAQAIEFSGWGAVKQAGITDDRRIRVDLRGRGAQVADLVIESRRGRWDPPSGETTETVTGPTAAFLLAAVDRREWWDLVGPLTSEGDAAGRFAAGYVIWL